VDHAKLYRDEPEYVKVESTDADWAVWRDNDKKCICIRFKDTTSFKDVLIDLLFWTTKVEAFDGADWKVHYGFKKAYYSCRNAVLDKCYELYQDGDAFLLLGHSLGGAMALIAAEDISWHFKTKVQCITWGAPRVTTQKKGIVAINQCLTDESFNFEFSSDPFPVIQFWFKKNPRTTHLGAKFSLWKAIKDIPNQLHTYHCAYSDASIYSLDLG
jgi:hypothetical protein